MKSTLSLRAVLIASAVFLWACCNVAFFRNVQAVLSDSSWAGFHLVSLALVLLGLLLVFLVLFSPRPILKPFLVVIFLVSAMTAYFMDTYNVIIDSDMIVNVVSTDTSEAGDLITGRFFLYLIVLGILPSAVLLPVRIEPVRFKAALKTRFKLVGVSLALVMALMLISSAFYATFFREHKSLRYYANPLTPVYGLYKYGKNLLATPPHDLTLVGGDAEISEKDIDRELILMVVGETARTDRLSINGYPRQTNPNLEQEDVISFTGVSACGTSTAISVPCMFSVFDRGGFDSDEADLTENALDVLKHAGVNILWRDNNSSSKGVADRVATEDFRSPDLNSDCDEECRDEGMLHGLQAFIDQHPEGDILIVLHSMGSHGPAYYKRYPPQFEVFTPVCKTSQIDDCSAEEIGNAYDNSILYTDYFLSRVIELLKNNDSSFETAMMYVSDHGESLGESGLYLHGLPYVIAPEAQTSVPVIFWFGRNYLDIERADMKQLSGGEFSHDHVFHTLLGLFEVESEIYQPDRDLLHLARSLPRLDEVGSGARVSEMK